jgi:hypothetical protein
MKPAPPPVRKDRVIYSRDAEFASWQEVEDATDVEAAILRREARYEQGERRIRDFHFEWEKTIGARTGPEPDYLWVPTLLIPTPSPERPDIRLRFSRTPWTALRKQFGFNIGFEKARVRGREFGMSLYQDTVNKCLESLHEEPRLLQLYKGEPTPCDHCDGAGTLPDTGLLCPYCVAGKVDEGTYTLRNALRPKDFRHHGERSVWDTISPILEAADWRPLRVRFSDLGISFEFRTHRGVDIRVTSYPGHRPIIRIYGYLPTPIGSVRVAGSCVHIAHLHRPEVGELIQHCLDRTLDGQDDYVEAIRTASEPWEKRTDLMACIVRATKARHVSPSLRTRVQRKVAIMAQSDEGTWSRATVSVACRRVAADVKDPKSANALEKAGDMFAIGILDDTIPKDHEEAVAFMSKLDRDKLPVRRAPLKQVSFEAPERDPRHSGALRFDRSGMPGTPSGQASGSGAVGSGGSS